MNMSRHGSETKDPLPEIGIVGDSVDCANGEKPCGMASGADIFGSLSSAIDCHN